MIQNSNTGLATQENDSSALRMRKNSNNDKPLILPNKITPRRMSNPEFTEDENKASGGISAPTRI